jgi:hypothetical protein
MVTAQHAGHYAMTVPDPRRYGTHEAHGPLGRLVSLSANGNAAARGDLLGWLKDRLAQKDDATILGALSRVVSHAQYTTLWELLCAAAEHVGEEDESGGVALRLFAIPLVLVTAARARIKVPGTLSDVATLHGLFERHGAMGATRNFGLGNALCASDTLDGLEPSSVYAWRHNWSQEHRAFPPDAIDVHPGREQVHLRFFLGAGISPRDAPSFLETASNIGAWGVPVARELARQLAQPGLELLALPRPPLSLLRAPQSGRVAALETAFNLFVSNTVRNFRASVGDPSVVISAHTLQDGGAELRVSLSSTLDETLLEGFRWPLHPLDDIDWITETVMTLLRECRVHDIRQIEEVLCERLPSGKLFMRADDDVRAMARH